MKQYINDNTIVKHELYNAFKKSILFSLFNLIFYSVMSINCQNVYCK